MYGHGPHAAGRVLAGVLSATAPMLSGGDRLLSVSVRGVGRGSAEPALDPTTGDTHERGSQKSQQV